MYTVLISASNSELAVGLAVDGHLIDEIEYEAWQRQSELLVAELDRLFRKNAVSREKISAVVASKGPGSYTGVRIALTVAKVMAFALGIPLYLSSSLEAMKMPDRPTICLMNARSKRSYIGVYDGEKTILADQAMDNESVLDYIAAHQDWAVSGDVAYLGLRSQPVDVLANLAKAATDKNLVKDPIAAKPVYLKDK